MQAAGRCLSLWPRFNDAVDTGKTLKWKSLWREMGGDKSTSHRLPLAPRAPSVCIKHCNRLETNIEEPRIEKEKKKSSVS